MNLGPAGDHSRIAPGGLLSYDLDAAEVPEARPAEGARVRVLVGVCAGVEAPFVPVPRITLLDVHLNPGVAVEIPAAPEHGAIVLVVAGLPLCGTRARVGDAARRYRAGEMGLLEPSF